MKTGQLPCRTIMARHAGIVRPQRDPQPATEMRAKSAPNSHYSTSKLDSATHRQEGLRHAALRRARTTGAAESQDVHHALKKDLRFEQ